MARSLVDTCARGRPVGALAGTAGWLYHLARDPAPQHYERALGTLRDIQDLASRWALEAARVKSDTFSHFDALIRFIPAMRRLRNDLVNLTEQVDDVPLVLRAQMDAYLHTLAALQERIERFKTGYSVVRNSVRFLPAAAATLSSRAAERSLVDVVARVGQLSEELGRFVDDPSRTARERLTPRFESFAAEASTFDPAVADAMVEYTSHALLLLAEHGPTEAHFAAITTPELPRISRRLVALFDLEIERHRTRARYAELAGHGALALVPVLWLGILWPRARRRRSPRTGTSPRVVRGRETTPASTPVPAATARPANARAERPTAPERGDAPPAAGAPRPRAAGAEREHKDGTAIDATPRERRLAHDASPSPGEVKVSAAAPEKPTPLPDLPPLPVDPAELDLSEISRTLQSESEQRDAVEDTLAPTLAPAPGEAGAREEDRPPPVARPGAAPAKEGAARTGEAMTLEDLVAALDLPEDQEAWPEDAAGAADRVGDLLGVRAAPHAKGLPEPEVIVAGHDPLAREADPEGDPLRSAPALREAEPERAASTPAPVRDEVRTDHTRRDPSAAAPAMEDKARSAPRTEVPPPTVSESVAPWTLGAARARALALWSVDEGPRREAIREAMARTAPAPVDYDLGECVAAALRAVAPGPEIAVRVHCPPGIRMRGDPLALRWMVCELVDNAIGALAARAPEHPQALSVSCGLEADGNATIRCLDSGAGFEDGAMPPPAHEPGGLALLRTALAAEGGTLSLHSLRGRGTLAVLSVPYVGAKGD